MPKVSLDGVSIYYEVHGEGEPLMLVHGALASHTMWKYQVDDLSKSFKVITCDLRGHGESDKADPSTYSIQLFAEDLNGLAEKLGVEKTHLVGYSMGGLVAAQFALDYPDRLHTLVLGGTPTKMPPAVYSWLARLTPGFMIKRIAKLTVPRLAYDPKGKIAEEGTELMTTWLSQAGKTVMIAVNKAGRAYFKKTPELSSIPVPVLIVCGEKDSLANGEELHRLIPRAKLVVVERAGHYLPMERPEVFNRLISDFCVA